MRKDRIPPEVLEAYSEVLETPCPVHRVPAGQECPADGVWRFKAYGACFRRWDATVTMQRRHTGAGEWPLRRRFRGGHFA